jgi:fructose-specific phosphotransferase system component IIB
MERGNEMIFGVLTNLTGDEILNATRRIEEVYLQFQKFIKANNVESATRRAIKPTAEIVEEQRRRNEENAPIEKRMRAKADKGKKQRSTRMDKLQEMFPNMSREDIKKMMDEDIEL